MITLTVDNSYSRIQGLSVVQEKELRILLSYTVGGSSAYFSGYGIRKKSLLDKKGFFPTGLGSRVMSYLLIQKYDVNIKDLRKRPKKGLGMFKLCL